MVLIPDGIVAVAHDLENAGVYQPLQPYRKYVGSNAQVLVKIIEAVYAEKCFPDDQGGPPVYDQLNQPRRIFFQRFLFALQYNPVNAIILLAFNKKMVYGLYHLIK